MACYSPKVMYPPKDGGRWTFNGRRAEGPGRVVPCNRCEGCQKARVSQWTVRLINETKYHDARPLMATLTYRNEALPADYSVSKPVLQEFMYRLRKRCGDGIRFFGVGEYGSREDATRRPHYHIILWSLTLDDLCDASETQSGFIQYRSPLLESVWSDRETGEPRGFVQVSYADRAAFSYVAGYCHKKLGGPKHDEEYRRVHPVTGEVVQVAREFALMSRGGKGGRGGIGSRWFSDYADNDARSEFVVINGRRVGLPGYYRRRADALDVERLGLAALEQERGAPVVLPDPRKLRKGSPEWLALIQDRAAIERLGRLAISGAVEERQLEADARMALQAADLTPERLAVRRELQILQAASLARGGSSR